MKKPVIVSRAFSICKYVNYKTNIGGFVRRCFRFETNLIDNNIPCWPSCSRLFCRRMSWFSNIGCCIPFCIPLGKYGHQYSRTLFETSFLPSSNIRMCRMSLSCRLKSIRSSILNSIRNLRLNRMICSRRRCCPTYNTPTCRTYSICAFQARQTLRNRSRTDNLNTIHD